MEVTISMKQYAALSGIYGPPQNIHYMIVCASFENENWVLEGKTEEFDELLSLISEVIGEGLCSTANARELLGICKQIDPSSLDWIGQ
jgi:hypothetical protein